MQLGICIAGGEGIRPVTANVSIAFLQWHDLLHCADSSTGTPKQATAFITEEYDGAICPNGFAVLRDVHGVDPLFLLAYMRTEFYLRQVRRMMGIVSF
jgi:hypothetical protein